MITYCRVGETAAEKRRFYFLLLDSSGNAVTGQTGDPDFSKDGAAFTSTGIGSATEVSNGLYYADLDSAPSEGFYIARWKPGTTVEQHAYAMNTIQVGGNVGDALARLTNETQTDKVAFTTKVYDAGGVSGANVIKTLTVGPGGTNKSNITMS